MQIRMTKPKTPPMIPPSAIGGVPTPSLTPVKLGELVVSEELPPLVPMIDFQYNYE
jgi:hypothetical protein